MTHVAITHSLVQDVSSRIRTMANQELSAEIEPTIPLFTGAEPWLAPALWGALHGTEFERHAELTCNVAGTLSLILIGHNNNRSDEMNVLSLGVPRWFRVGSDTIKIPADSEPAFLAHIQWRITRGEINARWYKVQQEIIAFLESAKSLNEALKLWPDLSRYVPAGALAKVAEKKEKVASSPSGALERLKAMDLETIATSTVLARMSGGAT